jgi:hypothetical protein
MFEVNILELNRSTLVLEINRVLFLFHDWLCIQHMEKFFYINAGFIKLSEQSPHVKQRSSQL